MLKRVLSKIRSTARNQFMRVNGPISSKIVRYLARPKRIDIIDPAQLSFSNKSDRQEVKRSLFRSNPSTAVLFAFGQSNIANECDPNGKYVPGPEVYNFDFLSRRIFVAKDPLLGATIDRSNFLSRLGDMLIRRGQFQRVLLVPIAYGGTYMREWAPGGRMHPRLLFALRQLRRRGIKVTHALYQQGEAEGAQANYLWADWARDFNAMVGAIRATGMAAPIFVAQCTESGNGPSEPLRSIQRSVVDPAQGILAGPDLDMIGPDERWDRCHFSVNGLNRAAELWFDILSSETAAVELGKAPLRVRLLNWPHQFANFLKAT